jgi:hypothetical protein
MMIAGIHRTIRRMSVAVVAIVAAAAVAAAAPFDDDLAEERPAPQEQVQFQFAEQNIDQWMFGNWGNAVNCRTRLEGLLNLQIDEVVTVCGAAADQQMKLRLAGRGDVRRFFDRVTELRKKIDGMKNDQNKINEIFQQIQPIQQELNTGLFGQGSLFDKTVRTILTAEQAVHYRRADRQRRQFRYRAVVEQVVSTLDEVAALRDEQRQKLVALLLESTRPPRRFGQYDSYVVLLQISRLPEDKLKALLDDSQWRALKRQFVQFQGIEPFLKNQGLLPEPGDVDPESDPPSKTEAPEQVTTGS